MPLLGTVTAERAIYLDVGANQPTRLSNTYWLYRRGFSGIAVEPDPSLANLWRAIRPRDALVCAGCGTEAGISSFKVARASVASAISLPEHEVARTIAVPILTLDQVASLRPDLPIALLSVDVEGHECEVLRGGPQSLARTAIALIEENGRRDEICRLLSPHGLKLSAELGCNLLFKNEAVLRTIASDT